MFCTECGSRNADNARFCTSCGHRLDMIPDRVENQPAAEPTTPETASVEPIVAEPASTGAAETDSSPLPPAIPPVSASTDENRTIPLEQVADSEETTQETSSDSNKPATIVKRKAPIAAIISIIAALVTVAVVITAFITYRMELWGPRTVPTVEASNADDVVKQLTDKGFIVKKKQQYDATRKGGYIGLEGAEPGERLDKGSQVTVIESLGPGVPQGTVGSTAEQAEASLKSMGVKITEHEVVSENPGKVSVTMPADGQPVTDTDEGIHLGVGIEGDGIPVEIAGMDKEQAESELIGKGYTVTLEPRFSSRQYLGKIVGANPGIGVKTDATQVTLYYGVDASGRYDVLTNPVSDGTVHIADATHAERLIGKYCTEDGDCLSLSEGSDKYWLYNPLKIDGQAYTTSYDYLGLCPYAQASGACTPTGLASDDGMMSDAMKNALLSGNTGAFEVYSGLGLANCGTDIEPLGPGRRCDHGKLVDELGDSSGLVYKAKDFFVYMPVGADLSALESDDYFTNKSDYQPDKDRPYIIKRDNSDYKPVAVNESATGPKYDPFTPSQGGKPVKFKEAPNKKNVYYLVETPIDWNLIDGTATGDGDHDGDANGSDDSDSDPESAAAWKDLAGEYVFSSGAGGWDTKLTIASDGTFTGYYHDNDLGDIDGDHPKGSRSEAKFSGRFKSATRFDDGSYNLVCAADQFTVDGTKGAQRIENGMQITTTDAYGMEPCGTFTAYPKGYDGSKVSKQVLGWAVGAGYAQQSFDKLPTVILVNDNTQEPFYRQ